MTKYRYAGHYQDKAGNLVSTNIHFHQDKLAEIKAGFMDCFEEANKEMPVEALGIDSKEKFIRSIFQREVDDFNRQGVHQAVLESQEGNLTGYVSFNNIDELIEKNSKVQSEFKKLPEKSVYIRQLYVKPSSQKRGIGALIVNKVIYELFPNAEHIYVATRRINNVARKLYEKCGFKESHDNVHGLPHERYMSFELHRSN